MTENEALNRKALGFLAKHTRFTKFVVIAAELASLGTSSATCFRCQADPPAAPVLAAQPYVYHVPSMAEINQAARKDPVQALGLAGQVLGSQASLPDKNLALDVIMQNVDRAFANAKDYRLQSASPSPTDSDYPRYRQVAEAVGSGIVFAQAEGNRPADAQKLLGSAHRAYQDMVQAGASLGDRVNILSNLSGSLGNSPSRTEISNLNLDIVMDSLKLVQASQDSYIARQTISLGSMAMDNASPQQGAESKRYMDVAGQFKPVWHMVRLNEYQFDMDKTAAFSQLKAEVLPRQFDDIVAKYPVLGLKTLQQTMASMPLAADNQPPLPAVASAPASNPFSDSSGTIKGSPDWGTVVAYMVVRNVFVASAALTRASAGVREAGNTSISFGVASPADKEGSSFEARPPVGEEGTVHSSSIGSHGGFHASPRR